MSRNNPIIYFCQILKKYEARDLSGHALAILKLKSILKEWAGVHFIEIIEAGSRKKKTAISLASDLDLMVSLKINTSLYNGGLKGVYESLYSYLSSRYQSVRKQSVSVRLNINGLEIDVTPAQRQGLLHSFHSIYLSNSGTWQKTNVKRHVFEVLQSKRMNEIKLLKIWRELHQLDFPSIYLEYLLIKKMSFGTPGSLGILPSNFLNILDLLSKDISNPLFDRIVDPGNSNNILSDLLSNAQKNQIKTQAKQSLQQNRWENIIW